MAARIPAGLTASEGRRFGVTVGVAFLAVGGLLAWRGHAYAAGATSGLGVALILAGLLVPSRLGPVYRAWMGLASLLSRITTPVMLGVLYFFVLTPVGLVRRLFGGNSLIRTRPGASAWVSRGAEAHLRTDMKRQF